jgi:hypothetical protein
MWAVIQMNKKVVRVRRTAMLASAFLGLAFVATAIILEFQSLALTPGFGVVQTLLFLLGVTLLTFAGYVYLGSRRPADAPRSLQADIGLRLSLTGLVLSYVCGFADLIRIGTHVQPDFDRPFIGPLQLGGLVLGLIIILAGMLLYFTSRGKRETSSLEFLLNGKNHE